MIFTASVHQHSDGIIQSTRTAAPPHLHSLAQVGNTAPQGAGPSKKNREMIGNYCIKWLNNMMDEDDRKYMGKWLESWYKSNQWVMFHQIKVDMNIFGSCTRVCESIHKDRSAQPIETI